MAKLTKAQAKAKLKALQTAADRAFAAFVKADAVSLKADTALNKDEARLNAIIWGT